MSGRKKKQVSGLTEQIRLIFSCKTPAFGTQLHPCVDVVHKFYLAGLSDGMSVSVKTSSGLGSGMGMMYSLYEGMSSSLPSSCLRSLGTGLRL